MYYQNHISFTIFQTIHSLTNILNPSMLFILGLPLQISFDSLGIYHTNTMTSYVIYQFCHVSLSLPHLDHFVDKLECLPAYKFNSLSFFFLSETIWKTSNLINSKALPTPILHPNCPTIVLIVFSLVIYFPIFFSSIFQHSSILVEVTKLYFVEQMNWSIKSIFLSTIKYLYLSSYSVQ